MARPPRAILESGGRGILACAQLAKYFQISPPSIPPADAPSNFLFGNARRRGARREGAFYGWPPIFLVTFGIHCSRRSRPIPPHPFQLRFPWNLGPGDFQYKRHSQNILAILNEAVLALWMWSRICSPKDSLPILTSRNRHLPRRHIYDPFSLLESFTRAPVPRALYLGAADPGARILRVAFPWARLTHLKLIGILTTDDARDLIQCPALEGPRYTSSSHPLAIFAARTPLLQSCSTRWRSRAWSRSRLQRASARRRCSGAACALAMDKYFKERKIAMDCRAVDRDPRRTEKDATDSIHLTSHTYLKVDIVSARADGGRQGNPLDSGAGEPKAIHHCWGGLTSKVIGQTVQNILSNGFLMTTGVGVGRSGVRETPERQSEKLPRPALRLNSGGVGAIRCMRRAGCEIFRTPTAFGMATQRREMVRNSRGVDDKLKVPHVPLGGADVLRRFKSLGDARVHDGKTSSSQRRGDERGRENEILDGRPRGQGGAEEIACGHQSTIDDIRKVCSADSTLVRTLGDTVPKSTIQRLKSIMGYNSEKEIDAWHKFCRTQTDPAINNWYQHKLANPWIPPSVNKFLSKISAANWDITPHHSNYVETAHAGRNAETAIHVQLLTGILQAKERDNAKAAQLAAIIRNGWKIQKSVTRRNQLTNYDSPERESGVQEHKASLERQKAMDSQIKSIQEKMKIDRHRTDLKEQINMLRKDVEEEKSLRREWTLRRTAIDLELEQLRKGPLAGIRIHGRPTAERPSEDSNAPTRVDSPVENLDRELEPALQYASLRPEGSTESAQVEIEGVFGPSDVYDPEHGAAFYFQDAVTPFGGVATNGVEPLPMFHGKWYKLHKALSCDFAPGVGSIPSGMQAESYNTTTNPNLGFDMFMTTADLNGTSNLANDLMFDIVTAYKNTITYRFDVSFITIRDLYAALDKSRFEE
ncbi:hypothetical protein DFH09DRAFT_1113119 [Mycena vulgaris]|nr:hypothetical protein DFH09DRAFT_1113119 [Mycena vulgaris]